MRDYLDELTEASELSGELYRLQLRVEQVIERRTGFRGPILPRDRVFSTLLDDCVLLQQDLEAA